MSGKLKSSSLQGRICELFDLIDGPRVVQIVADEAKVSEASLRKYLRGESQMRLPRLGQLLDALTLYCKSHSVAEHVIRLIDLKSITSGLSETEYTELKVRDHHELLKKLLGTPDIDLRPSADEIIDVYEESEFFQKKLYIPLRFLEIFEEGGHVSRKSSVDEECGDFGDDELLRLVYDRVPVLFLLGDLGTGKTTTVRYLEYRLAQNFKKDFRNAPFPVYINLRDFTKALSVEWCLLSFFSNLEEALTAKGIRKLVQAGRFVFLFDGFDEMAERLTSIVIERNSDQIALWSHSNGVLLLSSRTHLYDDDRQLFEAYRKFWPSNSSAKIGKPLVLQPFNEEDWTTYLNRVFKGQAAEFKILAQSIDGYESLMSHPLLLDMTTKVIPKLAKHEKIRRTDVFAEYVNEWFTREKWRCSLSPSQRLELAEELAWLFFINKTTVISVHELQELTNKFFSKSVSQLDMDALHKEIQIASFLTRTGDGKFSFLSPVFNYYFLARAFHKRIQASDSRFFGREKINGEVLGLMAEMKPDTSTLMNWASRHQDSDFRDAGQYLHYNAKAILERINPIRTELLGKLQYVTRKTDFAKDPILAQIANETLPLLKDPVRAVDIFEAYVEPRLTGANKNGEGEYPPHRRMHLMIEEFAWFLYVHNVDKTTPDVIRASVRDVSLPSASELRELFSSYDFLRQDSADFMFQHEYLRDYFLARAVLHRLSNNKASQAGHALWSERVLELLAEMKPSAGALSKWIQVTRDPYWNIAETGLYLASNAASLLHVLGKQFDETTLEDATLTSAVLPGVDFHNRSLARVALNGANLSGANLKEAFLREVNFAGANLTNAYLSGADLTGADLTGADLTGAYLLRADLTKANFTDAKLDRTVLTGATQSQTVFSRGGK